MAKEIVRKEPDKKYLGQPCSVTCVGTAYDHIHTWPFTIIKPEGMRYDGYLRLRDMNQFAREYLPIAKRISKSKESQESIPESEMQEFLDAVANGLLYIEKERKSRYQRIDEAEKTAFARGEAEGKEDKLIATVRELEEKQALREEQENKLYHEALSHTISFRSTRTEWVRLSRGGW